MRDLEAWVKDRFGGQYPCRSSKFVEGAEPLDVLDVKILRSAFPDPYGVNVFINSIQTMVLWVGVSLPSRARAFTLTKVRNVGNRWYRASKYRCALIFERSCLRPCRKLESTTARRANTPAIWTTGSGGSSDSFISRCIAEVSLFSAGAMGDVLSWRR